jgi:hypothetical protein
VEVRPKDGPRKTPKSEPFEGDGKELDRENARVDGKTGNEEKGARRSAPVLGRLAYRATGGIHLALPSEHEVPADIGIAQRVRRRRGGSLVARPPRRSMRAAVHEVRAVTGRHSRAS